MTKLAAISGQFRIYGVFHGAKPFGTGHINDTFLITFNQAGTPVRYVLRKINREIFRKPEIVIHNTATVIDHIQKKLTEQHVNDRSRRVLTMVDALDGKPYIIDDHGETWCASLFLENTNAREIVETAEHAYQAAKTYGFFQRNISDLQVDTFRPTISNFHNIVLRYEQFENALKTDPFQRANAVQQEIDFALKHRYISEKFFHMLENGVIPFRVTHNDTKLNNVLTDRETGEGLCVTDLDTVMPGTVCYDFGDMVRSFTSPVAEDERNSAKVTMRIHIFEALSRGYLEQLVDILQPAEWESLVFGAKLMTLMMGIRFLTDYLMGDVYYKTSHEWHNLNRCRTQFRLITSIEEQEDKMEAIVKKIRKVQARTH